MCYRHFLPRCYAELFLKSESVPWTAYFIGLISFGASMSLPPSARTPGPGVSATSLEGTSRALQLRWGVNFLFQQHFCFFSYFGYQTGFGGLFCGTVACFGRSADVLGVPTTGLESNLSVFWRYPQHVLGYLSVFWGTCNDSGWIWRFVNNIRVRCWREDANCNKRDWGTLVASLVAGLFDEESGVAAVFAVAQEKAVT